MQKNEFKFSRQKVWYEEQTKVLGNTFIKLTEIISNFKVLLHILNSNRFNEKPMGFDEFATDNEVKNIVFSIQENINYISAKRFFTNNMLDPINLIIDTSQDIIDRMSPRANFYSGMLKRPSTDEVSKLIDIISVEVHSMSAEIKNIFL